MDGSISFYTCVCYPCSKITRISWFFQPSDTVPPWHFSWLSLHHTLWFSGDSWYTTIEYDTHWFIYSHRLALTNIKRTGFLSIGLIAWVLPHQWDCVTRERCHTSLLDGLSWTTCGWQDNKFQPQTSQGLLFSARCIGGHWDSMGRWDWQAIKKKFPPWCLWDNFPSINSDSDP